MILISSLEGLSSVNWRHINSLVEDPGDDEDGVDHANEDQRPLQLHQSGRRVSQSLLNEKMALLPLERELVIIILIGSIFILGLLLVDVPGEDVDLVEEEEGREHEEEDEEVDEVHDHEVDSHGPEHEGVEDGENDDHDQQVADQPQGAALHKADQQVCHSASVVLDLVGRPLLVSGDSPAVVQGHGHDGSASQREGEGEREGEVENLEAEDLLVGHEAEQDDDEVEEDDEAGDEEGVEVRGLAEEDVGQRHEHHQRIPVPVHVQPVVRLEQW
mmetsp:Transcript_1715/g.3032  ORF Transcript_1715/g.3032 Transcript_1715/m.3032 type:complete len:273 (+) Transcript_1715:1243-2061(+)